MIKALLVAAVALPLASCIVAGDPARPYAAYVCPDGSPPLVRTAAEARERGKAMMGDSISRDDRYAYEAIDQEDYWLVYKRPIERAPTAHIEGTRVPGRISSAVDQVEVSKCSGIAIGGSIRR